MIRELHYNTVFDAQRHFRVLLDCMARPGKVNQLDDVALVLPNGLGKAAALFAFALLNTDATFWLEPTYSEAIEYLHVNTGANLIQVSQADFLFLHGASEASTVEEVKIGTLQYPEQGATLVIQVETISKTLLDNSVQIELSGPGIKDSNNLYIIGITTSLLELIQSKNDEFPLGVDVVFTDQDNQITCVPRSSQLVIKM